MNGSVAKVRRKGRYPMSVEDQTARVGRSARRVTTVLHYVTRMHTFLYRLTGGAIGGRMGKNPVLLLTTRGHKTGKQHTTPLLYLAEGDHLVTVASNGGAPAHPFWWLNLQANSDAYVQVGLQKLLVTARQATREERNRLWPLVTAMYPGYADYQKQTTREIAVVILRPIGGDRIQG